MHFAREEALKDLGDGVEDLVKKCLYLKRELDAIDDSNRLYSREMGKLRQKYETLLMMNKKDANIIMNLKNSEALLRQAKQDHSATGESLRGAQFEKQELQLEKSKLEIEKGKFFLKCQVINKKLRSMNMKQKQIQDLIEELYEVGEKDKTRHAAEKDKLKSSLGEDGKIVEDLKALYQQRDSEIEKLKTDIQDGLLKANLTEKSSDSPNDENVEVSKEETEKNEEDKVNPEPTDLKTKVNTKEELQNPTDQAIQEEWRKKNALFEAAEKENHYLMQIYEILNERMFEINSEIMNVKEFFVKKDADRRHLLGKVKELEELVAIKRKKFTIPTRKLEDELSIRIEYKRELNEVLRNLVCTCLLYKSEDDATNSTYRSEYKEHFLSILRPKKPQATEETDQVEPTEPQDYPQNSDQN